MMRVVGRYSLHDEIASGGMATVLFARQRGEQGFSRVVAVKMLHAQYAKEESFRAMFLDEARLVSRIRHPNVVATLDVLEADGDLFLVMDYVHGASLSGLLKSAAAKEASVPASIAVAILGDVLEGLHAAHEATSEQGAALGVVHRDVSPQNILVGVDGVAKVADFGVAKAVGRLAEKFSVHHTVKGKAGYMAPEQIRGRVDRRTDVYGAGVVLWETLVGQRLYDGESFLEIVAKSMDGAVELPSRLRPDLGASFDEVVQKALAVDPTKRYATAREMAIALEQCTARASAREVGQWVGEIDRVRLALRGEQIARIESAAVTEDDAATRPDLVLPHVEAVGTEAGVTSVAPFAPLEAIPSGPGVDPSGSLIRGPWRRLGLALSVVVAASAAAMALLRPRAVPLPEAPASAPPPAVSAVSAPPPATPVAATAIVPAPPLQPAVSSTPARAQRPAPRRVAPSPARPERPAPSPAAATASTCHWEQLPDEQGIMIPKKVCP